MQHLLAAVQMLNELRDTPGVFELGVLGLARLLIGGALIRERDQQSLVQECQFAQPLRQRVVVVLGRGKDAAIGQEMHFRPAFLGRAGFLQLAVGFALGIVLLPGSPVAPDLQLKILAECIHAGHAHTVQSARNFVGRRIEFPPGVQGGHHYLRRGNFLAVNVHVVHGNAAAVIDYRDRVVDVDRDFNLVGETSKRLIDGIIDNFVDQMVQSQIAGRADVHSRPQAYGFHAAEHFDGVGSVVAIAAVDGANFSVFCFSLDDGCRDLSRGHSTPWRMPGLKPEPEFPDAGSWP